MRAPIAACLALALFGVAAADPLPVLNAALAVGKEDRFVLVSADGRASSWLRLGDSFDGYALKAYDRRTAALRVEKDGAVCDLVLAAESMSSNDAPNRGDSRLVAEATAVLDAMNFERMVERAMKGVKQQQVAAITRESGTQGGDREAVYALQRRVLDELLAAVNVPELKLEFAKAYSEAFTKQELQGLASFYASPIGQAFSEKQPELSAKLQAAMLPRVQSALPRIHELGRAYFEQARARRSAGKSGGGSAVDITAAVAP